jgi:hypothetical protein
LATSWLRHTFGLGLLLLRLSHRPFSLRRLPFFLTAVNALRLLHGLLTRRCLRLRRGLFFLLTTIHTLRLLHGLLTRRCLLLWRGLFFLLTAVYALRLDRNWRRCFC